MKELFDSLKHLPFDVQAARLKAAIAKDPSIVYAEEFLAWGKQRLRDGR